MRVFLLITFSISLLATSAMAAKQEQSPSKKKSAVCSSALTSDELRLAKLLDLHTELAPRVSVWGNALVFSPDLASTLDAWAEASEAFPLLGTIRAISIGEIPNGDLLDAILSAASQVRKNSEASHAQLVGASEALSYAINLLAIHYVARHSLNGGLEALSGLGTVMTMSNGPAPLPQEDILASVNETSVPFFAQGTLEVVDALNGRAVPARLIRPYVSSKPTRKRLLLSKSEGPFLLPLPRGFTFEEADFTGGGRKNPNDGSYVVDGKHEFSLPLFQPTQKANYTEALASGVMTSSSRVKLEEWPQHIQSMVEEISRFDMKGHDKNLFIAGAIQEYIHRNFLYAAKAPVGDTVPERVHSGKLRCDTAAILMLSLLREKFNIPCRLKFGILGSEHQSHPGVTFALGSMPHVVLEVFDKRGYPEDFDPTPPNTDDPSFNKKRKKSGFQGVGTPGFGAGSSQMAGASAMSLVAGIGPGGNVKSEQKLPGGQQAGTQVGVRDPFASPVPRNSSSSSSSQSGRGRKQGVNQTTNRQVGSSILSRSLLGGLGRWAMDPFENGTTRGHRVSVLRSLMDKPAIMPFFGDYLWVMESLAELQPTYLPSTPPLANWIQETLLNARSQSLAQTVESWNHQLRSLRYWESTDPTVFSPMAEAVEGALNAVMSMGIPNGEKSRKISLVQELMTNLPGGVTKRAIAEQHHVKEVGNNRATLALGEKIQNGEMSLHWLSALVGPYTRFIIEPEYVMTKGQVMTWWPSQRQRGPLQMLVTSDPRTAPEKLIPLNPALDPEVALRTHQMATIGVRQRIPIASGYRVAEEHTTTVLLYDTSGSMGSLEEFVIAYLQAFIDRAFSDVGSDGVCKHQVWLVGFDSEVHTVTKVKTLEDAIAFVRGARYRGKNTGGGTGIQTSINKSLELIREEDVRATLVLLSDGYDEVSGQKLQEAFDSVLQTGKPVRFGAVEIGHSNPDLAKLALQTETQGGRMNYIAWTQDKVKELIEKSKKDVTPTQDFWSDRSWHEFVQKFPGEMERLVNSLAHFNRTLSDWRESSSGVTALRNLVGKNRNASETQRLLSRHLILSHLNRLFDGLGRCGLSSFNRAQFVSPFSGQAENWFEDGVIDGLELKQLELLLRFATTPD